MKVTLNWLKQYVEFGWSPEELAERLTMLGLEVEGVHKVTGEFEGIVVAQVITRDKHPNADKLSLCRVNDGNGERQIVCGAQNFKPGDKVPLILPGASLPLKPGESQPVTIKVGKIRGVESHGMMCSPKELGISEDAEGLLILPDDAEVGQPFAEYLGRASGDVVYDLEVTPNRPDLNSVIGIAREIAAVTGNPLKIPDVRFAEAQGAGLSVGAERRDHVTVGEPPTRARESQALLKVEDFVAVRIEDVDLCPRYVARVVRGVKIGASPHWLRSTLERVGLRSINNVVDVTNYVMLEVGQPLHAFDYHLIARTSSREAAADSAGRTPLHSGGHAKPTIVIRRARDGEKFTTLDGVEHTLTRDMLLIADETKAIALAGVMGGQNSEINDQTADVLIESACFSPTNIRRTSKALGLRTDASYRFERGADIGITDWASLRCARLIVETAGGQLSEGVVDAYPNPAPPKEINLRFARTGELLGVEIPIEEQTRLLTRVGLEALPIRQTVITPRSANSPAGTSTTATAEGPANLQDGTDALPGSRRWRIPTFRVDLKREIDLIEEICRFYGVERVPATPPRGAIGFNAFDAVYDQLAEMRRILTGLGLNEAQGQTLISGAAAQLLSGRPSAAPPVSLANPLSSDMNVLRPSLIPGLLDALRHNLHHQSGDVALFEVGRVFRRVSGIPEAEGGRQDPGGTLTEERHVAVALTGHRQQPFWSGENRDAKFDIFDLKGLIEEVLEQFGFRGVVYTRHDDAAGPFLEAATITLGGKVPIGEMGQLSPEIGRRYDLRDAVLLAELNLDQLLARRNVTRSFKPLPLFPSVRRDVAMIVPESVTHEAVLTAVRQARPANLERVELFDVFRGQNVPPGHKSMAYAFTYRHAERTLTDEEVNTAHEKLIEQFKRGLQATIR